MERQKKKTPIEKKHSTENKKSVKKKSSLFTKLRHRADNFLQRRPHRSFRLTQRRDYKRTLALQGYWSFTGSVVRLLRQNKHLFISFGLLYMVISVLVLGLASQESFTALQDSIAEAGKELYAGNWSAFGTAAALSISTMAGKVSPNLTDAQQIYAVILGLMAWLITIWLLRQRMAGHAVRLRDGLYSAGSPIVATVAVSLVMVLQMIPVLLAVVGFTAARNTGLLDGGIEAMLFWAVAGGLGVLSAYWGIASIVAMVIVTLPGMYPMRALQIAGDLVIGRRLRIILRLLWMGALLALFWAVVLIPIILLDTWIKELLPMIEWLPVVPVSAVGLSTISLIWTSSYIYVLYRGLVDDDARPA